MRCFLFLFLLPCFFKSQVYEKNFVNPWYFPTNAGQTHAYDTINGTYIITGDYAVNAPTGMVKINKSGDTLWTKKLHLHQGANFDPEAIIRLFNGNLVVIGYSAAPSNTCCGYAYNVFFDFYNGGGTFIGSDSIPLGMAQGYGLRAFGPDNNGDFYLSYRNDILSGTYVNRNAILEKRDANNIVLWQRQYSSFLPQGSSNYETIKSFAVSSDHNIVMIRNSAYVEKLDASGTTQFTVNPSNLCAPNVNTAFVYDICTLKDSSFIVMSQLTDTSSAPTNLKNFIVHYSKNGMLIDSLTLNNVFFNSIVESNSGELICNYNIYPPNSGIAGMGILFLNNNLTIRNSYPFNMGSGIYNTGKLSANNVGGAFYSCAYSYGSISATRACSFDSVMNTYPNKIYGTIKLDNDNDCMNSSADYNLAGNLICAFNNTSQSFISMTNSIGDYTLSLPTDSYTLQHTPTSNKLNSCAGYSVPISVTGTTVLLKNYFDTLVPNIKDLKITSFLSSRKPGDNTFLYILYQNNGTNTVTANISVVKDSSFQYLNASLPPNVISGDSLVYSFSNLKPDSIGQLILTFNINPSLPIGSNISVVSSCLQNNDLSPWDNIDSISTQASMWAPKNTSASTGFDENSIQVDKPFLIDGNETLVYKINFKNNNERYVKKLVIMDSISTNLDLTTFKIIKSTHTISNLRIEKNILYVVYENINIPDSASNDSLSKGFLIYSIKPKSTLPVGTLINSQCSFAFDLFPVIITNNVVNKINGYAVGVKVNNHSERSFLVFPNPATEHITVLSETNINSAELITTEGKIAMRLTNINLKNISVNLQHLPPGLYLMKISTERGVTVKKVAKN